MSDIAISCENVWKSYRVYHQRSHTLKEKVLTRRNRYDEFWALKGIDLEVKRGTTTGIIGTNGSGKSTLLKTIARILSPNRGSVKVNGTMASLLELGIGFHPELTGRENVYLSGSLLGHTRRDIDHRYDGIIEFAGIPDFMDTPVKNYSTGMYARLAFAVAVSVDPEILLIDEVLSVGDESFQMRCYERIAELRSEGRTIVLVSHALETIKSLCAHALWIDKGTMRDSGKAHDVVTSYLGDVYSHEDHAHQWSDSQRLGSGEAEITDVAILDRDGTPSGTFRTGDSLTMRIDYRFNEKVDRVSCGVAVFRADNLAYLFGHNSREAGLPLKPSGEGTIEYTVPDIPLRSGSYVVTVALHDTVRRIYDYHDRKYAFVIFDNPALPHEEGIVQVASEWKLAPARVPS